MLQQTFRHGEIGHPYGMQLCGKTLGIIGLGAIGECAHLMPHNLHHCSMQTAVTLRLGQYHNPKRSNSPALDILSHCCYECCHTGRSPEYWPCCYGLQLAGEFLYSTFTRRCFVANLIYPERQVSFMTCIANWYLLALPVVQCMYELPFNLQTWSCPQAEQRKLALVAGNRLAKTAEAIGMHVMGLNSKSTTEQLTSLLQQADIVSVHCPLTPKTNHLLG